MADEYYLTKTTFEKNSSNGLELFTSKSALAIAVSAREHQGGRVQVFKCTPVKHEVYTEKVNIEIYD